VGQVTAKQGCDYFATTDREVSANYVVGKDGSIGLSVEEKDRAWTSSSASNDHRAITIEVACDTFAPYKVTDAAYKALINLVADICKRNNIKELKWKGDKSLIGQVAKQNMTVHRWFSATACPGDYLYSKHADIATKVNALLKPAPKVETTSKTLYRVQVGAYSKKENAEAMAKKLKSLGFDAIITTVSK
jgi:N-acetyl-anhydromuramyl-L-alanine amidase AmpD